MSPWVFFSFLAFSNFLPLLQSDRDNGIQRQQVVNSQMLAQHILVTQVRANIAAKAASQRQEARDAEVLSMVVGTLHLWVWLV
jgi:hypothetical protein